jgi:hypothetical protein
MRRVAAIALSLLPALAHAQPITVADAAVPEGTYGCVEQVPRGAQKPIILDTFPTRGTSGWAATLSITVRHGKGEKVLPSGHDLSHAIEAKKVLKEAGFAIPEQDGGADTQVWSEKEDPHKPGATTHLEMPLVLLPEKGGRNGLVLPRLPVAIARANGEIMTLCTQLHPIVVDDPIANTSDPKPIGNPPAIPQREEWTALKKALGWGSLGLLLGAIVAWFAYKQVTKPKPAPPPPPPRPPWEVALEKLYETRHAGLLEKERYTDYFDRTSDAVRGYLGARFGFDGLESTTDEMLAALKKQEGGGFVRLDATPTDAGAPAPGISLQEIARFLRECDLVKFANLTPSPDQCTTAIEAGEKIVRATMPFGKLASPAPATDQGAAKS